MHLPSISGNRPAHMEPDPGVMQHDLVQSDSGVEQLDLADSVRLEDTAHQAWPTRSVRAAAWHKRGHLGQKHILTRHRPRHLGQRHGRGTSLGQDGEQACIIEKLMCWLGILSQMRPSLGICDGLFMYGLLWVS
ncbi:hypothetical protein Lalb_Chr09g0335171 [Lupinus albus]|uniref:Uncharacterized protein n=1 Tax=Lupinus albus TaxID=3870 RepID=A0A6A4Q2U4_LUPAL|nr:hypothetical protein Lalb_Chr09g0335171 [Lupinus albus]